MIYTVSSSAAPANGSKKCSCQNGSKKCSCAKAPAVLTGQSTGPAKPVGNNLFQVATRLRRTMTVPQGSNLYRKVSAGGKTGSGSRRRGLQGLGQDLTTFDPTQTIIPASPAAPSMPSADVTLTPDLTSFDSSFSLNPNQPIADTLAAAGSPPGVTPEEYATFITGATGVPVNVPAAGATTPAPITAQGLNPQYAATLTSAAQLAQAIAGGYLPQGTTKVSTTAAPTTSPSWLTQQSIKGVPNWALLAGGGGLILVLGLAAGKRKR